MTRAAVIEKVKKISQANHSSVSLRFRRITTAELLRPHPLHMSEKTVTYKVSMMKI